MKFLKFSGQTNKQLVSGALIGLLGGLLALFPLGYQFELEVGLDTLFKLRGATVPPNEVVVININRASAHNLNIGDTDLWPRSLHAQLIDNLSAAGAGLIVFDLVFDAPKNEVEDAQMADAMKRAGNVILTNYVRREEQITIDSSGNQHNSLYSDVVVPTFPRFKQAALASSPFLLPRDTTDIREFWLYKQAENRIPTLPTTAFLYYLVSQQINSFGETLGQNSWQSSTPNQLMDQLTPSRSTSTNQPELAPKAEAWVRLLRDNGSLMLNHYGPPKTIQTISYSSFFNPEFETREFVENKVVFIGFSDDMHPEWHPGYFTVYSKSQGTSISSVELAATAFSNLLDNNPIRVPTTSIHFAMLVIWGALLIGLIRNSPVSISILQVTVVSAVWLITTAFIFELFHLWLPVAIPLLLQAPLVVLLHVYFYSKKQQQNSEQLLSNIKRYLPPNVVAGFLDSKLKAAADRGILVDGICLGIDIQNYTSLSEALTPEELTKYLDDYYTIVLDHIRRDGAEAWDAAGDGFMVIWSNPEEEAWVTQARVCHTALLINQSLKQHNAVSEHPMQARFGLHCGLVRIGNIGHSAIQTYRAVGDAVNTASRIEQLNKELNTQILISESMANALKLFRHRLIGTFELKGKSHPVTVYEPICNSDEATLEITDFCRKFEAALAAFQASAFQDAKNQFLSILKDYPDDGPSRYYLNKCNT